MTVGKCREGKTFRWEKAEKKVVGPETSNFDDVK